MGTVPFDAIPAVLEEIGWRGAPVLEIISQQPDRDILLSVEKLTALGYGRSPARNAAT
jgi:hypothetical protein